MASSTRATMPKATGTTKTIKALFLKSHNMIVFLPSTTTATAANKAAPATVLRLVGATAIRTESRTVGPTQLGEIVSLGTVDDGTVQFIIGAMPKILEDTYREWFAKSRCKTFKERFGSYEVDFQAAYWVARRRRLGTKYVFRV